MSKDLTPLGELLETARERRRPKLSQNALAKEAQTSPTTYRRIITGIARFGGQDMPFEGSALALYVRTSSQYCSAMSKTERAPARLRQEPTAVTWAREKAGLNQAQLARQCGFTRSLICEIEGGTRNATPENLLKIAQELNCPVVFLERKREVAS